MVTRGVVVCGALRDSAALLLRKNHQTIFTFKYEGNRDSTRLDPWWHSDADWYGARIGSRRDGSIMVVHSDDMWNDQVFRRHQFMKILRAP